ncbi:unnamed protein product [Sympodiomycopsis kandeliae]
MATAARPMGPRAFTPNGPTPPPQPPQQYAYESPSWYEAEQRLAPSYIQQQPQRQQQQQQGYPFPSSTDAPYSYSSGSSSNLPPGAGLPYHYHSGQSNDTPVQRHQQQQQQQMPRMNASRFQSYPAPAVREGDQRERFGQTNRIPGGTAKGSAFMHKGFFDILQLVNDRSNAQTGSASRLMPPDPATAFEDTRNGPPSPSRLKATFSRATGALRRNSNAPAPATNATSPLKSNYENEDPFAAPLPNFGGPRAAKKRISIGMVSAPRPESFVHAAHASDAEQAEAILNRWGRDGVGKIADPGWVLPIKEALRLQAARNQAEAIAQVQANLHQDSVFRNDQRPLQVVNGTPSTLTTSTMTITSSTAASAGHPITPLREIDLQMPTNPNGQLQNDPNAHGWAAPFADIAEEERRSQSRSLSGDVTPHGAYVSAADVENLNLTATPRKTSPQPPPSTSPRGAAQLERPQMMPRTNSAGTCLINPTPSPQVGLKDGQVTEGPDYMAYRQVEVGAPSTLLQSPVSPTSAGGGASIDGLPGGANMARMFDPPASPLSPQRPTSMLVRDVPLSQGPPSTLIAANPQEMSATMAEAAGPALRPSLTTVEKSVAAKIYFENLYYGILKKPAARETRRAGLEKELAALRIPETSKEVIRQAWITRETEHLRDMRARVSANAFVKLKTIGHGAFGVVALVREKHTGQLFAMKQLRKADMLRKGQEGHVRAERDLMTSASASGSRRWIVNLVYSFQDVDHLYLIMEFMGGGDLLNLLIEKDIFPEDFARFYVAEMILAIHEAHKLGYIHRDIKPDNFLFTSEGHIKLADFGLCQSFHWAHDGAYYDQQRRNLLRKHGIDLDDAGAGAGAGRRGVRPQRLGGGGDENGQLNEEDLNQVMSDRNADGTPLTHVLTWRDKNKKKIAYSVVGTNNYMAPEVLRGLGYDQSCDWWSLGVIVFEMLYGYPPFVSKSRHMTRQKILNWKQTLRFPSKPSKVSREAQDFILRLVCEKDDRLGSVNSASVSRPNSVMQGARQQSGFTNMQQPNASGLVDGVEDLMSHPWFKGIDWSSLHRNTTPFRPNLSHPADTKHFEDDIDDEPLPAPGAAPGVNPADQARDPMLRDKDHGQRLLEMRKQLAFVGYTFKRPPGFDPREINEEDVQAAERAAAQTQSRLDSRIAATATQQQQQQQLGTQSTITASRIRAMSM